MAIAGIAWGIYTLAGRNSTDPISDTTFNFLRTIPFVLILFLVSFEESSLSSEGIILAMISGGLTSGIGYAVWYIALTALPITGAAVVQLLVPVIAALGGVIFANEIITQRLVLSSFMVLGGILLVVAGKSVQLRE
jgi:drug/metabolite transporter (DMT)-like permease